MRTPTLAAAFLGLAVLLSAPALRAAPQATVGLTVGAAGRGYDHHFWQKTVFHLGLRGDVIFGRSRVQSFGVGPYAEVFTNAFNELQFGTGVSTLLPVTEAFPIVISVGGYGRYGATAYPVPSTGTAYRLEPGVAASIFWGSRSYNFHANYVMSAGLLAQLRYGLGPSGETSIIVGAQLDLVAISLPFQMLYWAIRGGSRETAPVR
jgi:hypothetical protein